MLGRATVPVLFLSSSVEFQQGIASELQEPESRSFMKGWVTMSISSFWLVKANVLPPFLEGACPLTLGMTYSLKQVSFITV